MGDDGRRADEGAERGSFTARSLIAADHARHHAPELAVGQSVSLGVATIRGGRPGLLGPWLAAGLGLAVVTTVPNDGSTAPAAAVGAPRIAVALPVESTDLAETFRSPIGTSAATTPDVGRQSGLSGFDLDDLRWARSRTIDVRTVTPRAGHETEIEFHERQTWSARSLGSAASPEPTEPTDEQWQALRNCESSGDYAAVNASGKYRGAYQFDVPTWQSVGGTGDPAAAPAEEQDARALRLFQRRGASPWPFCGRHLRN